MTSSHPTTSITTLTSLEKSFLDDFSDDEFTAYNIRDELRVLGEIFLRRSVSAESLSRRE